MFQNSRAARYGVLEREIQSSGKGWDEEFIGYGSGDRRLKTISVCLKERLRRAENQCRSKRRRTLYLATERKEKISSQGRMLQGGV